MATLLGKHLQFSTIDLEVQGSLLAVANGYTRVPQSTPAHRGEITGFSLSSRKRMLRKAARLDAQKGVFVTLTYPARYPDPRTAKNHLRALLERFRRRYPKTSGLWKLEPQKRGAPHFHLLLFDMPFLPHWQLRAWWTEIIAPFVDTQRPFVRIEWCESRTKVLRYVAKYCGKVIADNSFFNNGSYLHAGPGPGRYWGVFAGQNLPMARRYYVQFSTIDPTGLRDILEVFTLAWDGVDTKWPHGVQVFSGESYRLFSLAFAAGLACKTHGTDVLYTSSRPTTDRTLRAVESSRNHRRLRIYERAGMVRAPALRRSVLGQLLHDDLSL